MGLREMRVIAIDKWQQLKLEYQANEAKHTKCIVSALEAADIEFVFEMIRLLCDHTVCNIQKL